MQVWRKIYFTVVFLYAFCVYNCNFFRELTFYKFSEGGVIQKTIFSKRKRDISLSWAESLSTHSISNLWNKDLSNCNKKRAKLRWKKQLRKYKFHFMSTLLLWTNEVFQIPFTVSPHVGWFLCPKWIRVLMFRAHAHAF